MANDQGLSNDASRPLCLALWKHRGRYLTNTAALSQVYSEPAAIDDILCIGRYSLDRVAWQVNLIEKQLKLCWNMRSIIIKMYFVSLELLTFVQRVARARRRRNPGRWHIASGRRGRKEKPC
jgi:hypothetical protein